MDILLLVITVVSLLLAAFFGFAAWGMWREERARSAARVAALAAAARDGRDQHAEPAREAWVHESTAPASRPLWNRPATLPTAANAVSAEPRGQGPAVPPSRPVPRAAEDLGDAFLGSAVAAPPSSGRQRGLAIAASLLFVALLTGAYFTVYGDRTSAEVAGAAGVTDGSPLELISLRHERQGDALAITGLVRNPNDGQRVDKLDAVAFLFDQQGAFVTSSRAGVDFTQLVPGDESPFVIRLDAPSTVARYRVSFRTESGVIPHIDRRGQEPIARDLP